MFKKFAAGLVGLLVLAGIIGALSSPDAKTQTAAAATEPAVQTSTEIKVESGEPGDVTPTAADKPKAKVAAKPTMTSGQRNALEKAESYLSHQAFSKKGLIEQLKFEEYSTADARWAVNRVKVSWNKQAVKKAESYLSHQAFSRQGLIEQLRFEGFTQSQAEYGVNAAY
jgi:hypothetical protein